jgi:hypothetical protein
VTEKGKMPLFSYVRKNAGNSGRRSRNRDVRQQESLKGDQHEKISCKEARVRPHDDERNGPNGLGRQDSDATSTERQSGEGLRRLPTGYS